MHEVSTMCKTVCKQQDSRKSETDKYLIQMRAAFTLSSVYYREYITYGDLTSSTLSSLSTMPLFFFLQMQGNIWPPGKGNTDKLLIQTHEADIRLVPWTTRNIADEYSPILHLLSQSFFAYFQQFFFVNAGKHVATRNRPDGKTEIQRYLIKIHVADITHSSVH